MRAVTQEGGELLLIEHFVAPSKVDGLGVFTKTDIFEGTKIYQFHPLIDRQIPMAEILKLPLHIVESIKRHGEYIENLEMIRLSADGVYYMNHSDNPNIEDRGDEMFACRTIRAGEELLCDYRISRVMAFDPECTSHRDQK